MIVLDVRDAPDVLGILTQRVTGELADLRPFEVAFAGVL
jgi:hypothetical protein